MPFSDLFSFNQWCPYRYIWDDKRQKYTKPPVGKNAKGGIDYDDSSTFWSFLDCIKYLVATKEGIISCGQMRTYRHGFIFPSKPCGIVAIDIDDCIVDGSIAEPTRQFISSAATYTEISPSGRGIRIFVLADASGRPHIADYQGISRIEVYASKGFVTTTHWHLPGTPITINRRQDLIDELYQHWTTSRKEPKPQRVKQSQGQTPAPAEMAAETPQLTSAAKRILKAAFKKEKFAACFNATSRETVRQHGFQSASDGFFFLLLSLATRCKKRVELIREIIRTAPIMSLVARYLRKNGNMLERQIQKACATITYELPFIPSGRRKRTINERIVAYLQTGPKTRQQIYQHIRQQFPATEMHIALYKLKEAGIIKRKMLTNSSYEIVPVSSVWNVPKFMNTTLGMFYSLLFFSL